MKQPHNPPRPLDAVFEDTTQRLRSDDPSRWPAEVTGKAVLRVFLRALQTATGRQPTFELLCSMYLEVHPDPPDELDGIVRQILTAAGT